MTATDLAQARILHIHARFPEGPSARRCRAVVSGLGPDIEHRLVVVGKSGVCPPPFLLLGGFPPVEGLPTLGRLQRLARAMIGFDLVCTYGHAAINAAMARTAFSAAFRLPPLIHHEDEDAPCSRPADWYRRIALGRCAGLVVPDERLEETALVAWQQPRGRVRLVHEGIDLAANAGLVHPGFLPNLLKRPGERWIGGITDFDAVEGPADLLEVVASLDDDWQLVLLGAGRGRDALRAEAERRELAHRVHMPGPPDPDWQAIGLFDIVLCPRGVADEALSAIHAMARGLPVLADRSSHAAALVPQSGGAHAGWGSPQFAQALRALAGDAGLRAVLGKANRTQAERHHGRDAMVAAYRRLYAGAMQRPSLP